MRILFVAALVALVSVNARSDDAKIVAPKKPEAFSDPATAGPDFAIQGEYQGQNSRALRMGAQVIARGDGKFDFSELVGGLPGDGCRDKRRVFFPMESRDGKTKIDSSVFQVEISSGRLRIKSETDDFTLERVVRQSPTLGMKPPAGATVLFDGTSVDHWDKGQLVEGSLLKWGTTSKAKFGDIVLHVEFRTPFMPKARGQERGNSGVYLQNRYEIQVLDSFGLAGEDNECGGIYKIAKPKVNMCYPPLSWQTYDVDFTAARFDDKGKKIADPVITVHHNGVLVHDKLSIPRPTDPDRSKEVPGPAPIYLQDHGNPVRFRNVWFVPKG